MSGKYLLIALPASIDRSHDPEEAFNKIRSVITPDAGTVSLFPIPEFKIGTLDALVRQADELAKLDSNVEVAVTKVVDVLRNIVPGQEAGHKLVGDSEFRRLPGRWSRLTRPAAETPDNYLNSFSWNKLKYRADKSIAENLTALQKVPLLVPALLLSYP